MTRSEIVSSGGRVVEIDQACIHAATNREIRPSIFLPPVEHLEALDDVLSCLAGVFNMGETCHHAVRASMPFSIRRAHERSAPRAFDTLRSHTEWKQGSSPAFIPTEPTTSTARKATSRPKVSSFFLVSAKTLNNSCGSRPCRFPPFARSFPVRRRVWNLALRLPFDAMPVRNFGEAAGSDAVCARWAIEPEKMVITTARPMRIQSERSLPAMLVGT